jgi:hypothetical protein
VFKADPCRKFFPKLSKNDQRKTSVRIYLTLREQPAAKPGDVSQAILKRKASPNKLLIDDATNDDNSVCSMNTATMEQLQLFRGYFWL